MPTGDSLYLRDHNLRYRESPVGMVMTFNVIIYNLKIKQDIKYCDP
jgi:hypothetical protein